MGPRTVYEGLLADVRAFERTHPQVMIKRPHEVPSGRWEVSFPESATIAFDTPEQMLIALSMVSTPAVEDEDGEHRSGSETDRPDS